MSEFTSQHHSFDIEIARIYGIEEAILIHHFQHWIRINKSLDKNFHEGRTWTYQTLDEIAAHFPYFTRDKIINIIDKLCTGKTRHTKKGEKSFEPILMKGNFNKSPYDRTVWYAFCVDSFSILRGRNIESEETQYQKCVDATPIPDTKTYTETKAKTKGEGAAPKSPPFSSHYKGKFEDKIQISSEQRKEICEKIKCTEQEFDATVEKLYDYSLNCPHKFKQYKRHDITVKNWMLMDMKKRPSNTTPKKSNEIELNAVQTKNWLKNQQIVSELKVQMPYEANGLYFYTKAFVLKDKNNPHFDLCGYIDHSEFCRILGKNLKAHIFPIND